MKHSGTKKRITAVLYILTVFACLFSSCGIKYTENTYEAMGSILSTKIYCNDKQTASELSEKINNVVAFTDKALSATDKEAEVYMLNRDGIIYASSYLQHTLEESVLLSNILGRNVDITIGKVSSLWGFNTDSPRVPDKKEIEDALEFVNAEAVLSDDDSSKITLDKGTVLDMNAFSEGAACDNIYTAVRNENASVLASIGGTLIAYGKGPDKNRWNIEIASPEKNSKKPFAILSLGPEFSADSAVFVSSVSVNEKSFTENGKTYHHILDPKTGYPVDNNILSVTVVTNSGLNADAISNALFVTGFNEQATDILDAFDAEAVFVFNDGTYYKTEGLSDAFTLKDKEYTEITEIK